MRSDLSRGVAIHLDENTAVQLDTCEQHGDFESKTSLIFGRQFRSRCPQCTEIEKARQKSEETAAKQREEQERLERKLGSALIPARFKDRSFDSYIVSTAKQKQALSACREYAENFAEHRRAGRCLLLLGNVGTGKTHLATAIASHIIRNTSYTAAYRTVGGILQRIKGSYDRESGYTEADAFAAYTRPGLLIIDEVGATKPSEFELATLFTIINGRYEEQLPTIVISNLPGSELAGALGERCVDRLREGGGIAVGFDWQSARKAAL